MRRLTFLSNCPLHFAFLIICWHSILYGLYSFSVPANAFISGGHDRSRSYRHASAPSHILHRNGLSVSDNGGIRVVEVRLPMTPTDYKAELNPLENVPEKDLDSNKGILSRVGNFFGGLFSGGSEKKPVPLSPVGIMDVQRYEPKGLVGVTMRVLRRRFFNLWARPPPSWANAVSQGDLALPGTFVSRKRVRLPNTRLLERSSDSSSLQVTRVGRLKNFLGSTVSSTSRRVINLATGRLGDNSEDEDGVRGYSESERDKYMNKDRDSYSMQINPSSQLSIFGRRRRDDNDYDSFLREEGEDANISPLRKLSKWVTEEMNSYAAGPLEKLTLRMMKDDSELLNPLSSLNNRLASWATSADADKFNALNKVTNFMKKERNSRGEGGWDISGYNDAALNSKQINELPVKALSGVRGLVSSLTTPVKDRMTLYFYNTLALPSPLPSSADTDLTISNNTRLDGDGIAAITPNRVITDNLGDIEPPWRWLVPNDYIAQSIIDMGNNVSSSFWSSGLGKMRKDDTIYDSFRDEGTSDRDGTADSVSNTDDSAITSLYRWLVPNDYIAQSVIDMGNNVSSSFWSASFGRRKDVIEHDSFLRDEGGNTDKDKDGILSIIYNVNIAQSAIDLGSNLSTSVWNTFFGPSINTDNESILRDIGDDKEGAVPNISPTDGDKSLDEVDPTWRLPEISSKLNDVKRNRYLHSLHRSKDVMIYLVSGATRYTFPVTFMIFRYAVAQPLGVLRSRGKGKVASGDSTMLEGYGSETAMSKAATLAAMTTMRNSENRMVRDTQLRQLLLVTTRVVPILRLVKPLQRWQRGGIQRNRDTGSDVMDVELEKEKDSFVHVGDSERFYDLWKDESKSKKAMKDGARVEGTNSQRGYEIGEYSPNFSFDEEAVSDSMKGKGQGVSLPGGAVREKKLTKKEDEALQSYDPVMVPGGNKVPFPLITGVDGRSLTIELITATAGTIATETVPSPAISIPNQGPSFPFSFPSLPGSFPSLPFDAFRSASLPSLPSSFRDFKVFGTSAASTAPSPTTVAEAEMSVRNSSQMVTDIADQDRGIYEGVEVGSIGDSKALTLTLEAKRAKTQELRNRPVFVDTERVPLPTKADLSFILLRRVAIAVTAALSCQTLSDAKEYQREIGLKSLISAVTELQFNDVQKLSGIKGMCRLVRIDNDVAVKVSSDAAFVSTLCDIMEAPLKGFRTFRSQVDKEKEVQLQKEVVALVQRIVRSSDKAVEVLRYNARLRKVLSQVAAQGDVFTSPPSLSEQQNSNKEVDKSLGAAGNNKKQLEKKKQERKEKKSYANTTVVEYRNQTSHQMARVASWGLGGVQWKGRQPGQKGLRILSFDGGGTRGVLSVAMLKELMMRISPNEKVQPYELFDIICGTSTGGIIAVLLGSQRRTVGETEQLYDDFIDKVFGKKSNLKLVSETAAYDELELEKLLYSMCGDELMLDSNRYDCSRVFCLSTKVNNNPPQAKVWRNYNYPPGQKSRYPGAFRVNTVTAVRATSAAPTFFTPVQWEEGLYCDGALVANNPTAIALQEAKVLYPDVPIELVVSIGTGYYNNPEKLRTMGWDLLVNQLIASSTDTEDVHALLENFLPEEKYFRFNPLLTDILPIDVKTPSILAGLKKMARDKFREMETGPEAKHVELLINTLKTK